MWSTLFIIQFIVTCCALPILLIINLFQWRVESKIHQEVGDIPRLLHRLLPISCLFLITFIIPDTSHDIHFIHNLLADLNSTLLLYGLTLIVYHTRATIARTDSTEIKHRKRWCHVVGISTACCALGVNVAEYHMDRLWPHTIFLIWYFTCLLIHIIAVLIFLLRLISLLEHHNVIMTGQNHSLSSLNPTSRFIRVTPTIASPTTVGRKLHPSGSSFSLPPSAHRRPSYHTLQKIAQDIARAQLISRFRVRVLLLVVPGVAALISLAASAVYLLANLSTPYGGAPNYASFIYCLIHICSITCATAFGWLTVTRIICQQILCCNQHIDMIPSHHRTPSTHSINKKTRTPKKEGIHVNLHPTSIPQSSPTERDSVLIEPSPLSATHVVKAFNAVPPAQLAEITSPSSSPSPCPSPSTSRTDDNLQHVPSVPSFVVMLLNAQQSQQSSHHPSPSTSLSHKAHTQHVHEMVTLHEFGPIAILSQDVSSSTSRMSMVEQQQSMVSDEKRHVSIVSDEKRHVSIVSDAKRHVSIDEKRHSMDEKRNSIDDHHISISQKPATIEEQDTDVTSDMV